MSVKELRNDSTELASYSSDERQTIIGDYTYKSMSTDRHLFL